MRAIAWWALTIGCATAQPASDAGAPDAHLIYLGDSGTTCAPELEGRFTCTGGCGVVCCSGRWHSFCDGPCWSAADHGQDLCVLFRE